MPVKADKIHETDYNEQPGMDVAMMEKDSTQWPENNMLNFLPLGAHAGPFVGDPYSGTSGLGTEREMITYARGGRGIAPRTKAAK